jgi:hypothetical protein
MTGWSFTTKGWAQRAAADNGQMLLPVQSYNELQIAITNSAWRAPIAAAVIGGLRCRLLMMPAQQLLCSECPWKRSPAVRDTTGGLMVIIFQIMSCAVLIRKSINRSGPSFGYGFIMAWYALQRLACC